MLIGWEVVACKLHFNVITISTWCHIISSRTTILCDLSKVTRRICNHMCHVQRKNSQKLIVNLCKFLIMVLKCLSFNYDYAYKMEYMSKIFDHVYVHMLWTIIALYRCLVWI
jgi:hypothetical protein